MQHNSNFVEARRCVTTNDEQSSTSRVLDGLDECDETLLAQLSCNFRELCIKTAFPALLILYDLQKEKGGS